MPLNFRKERNRNLVQILLLSKQGFTRTDHVRFLKSYFGALAVKKNIQKEIIQATLKWLEKRHNNNKTIQTGIRLSDIEMEKLIEIKFNNLRTNTH